MPFIVGFTEIVYTAFERDGWVEVCVNLTSLEGDRSDTRIFLEVYNNTHPGTIPANATAASKLALTFNLV